MMMEGMDEMSDGWQPWRSLTCLADLDLVSSWPEWDDGMAKG